MKKYTQKIFLSVGLSFLTLTHANADPAPLSLINLYPNTENAVTAQPSMHYYLLKNNLSKPIFFEFTPQSSGVYVNPRVSTCTYGLAAGASCKLAISFDAPNKLGQIQTQLNITTKDNNLIKLPLVYHVATKPKAVSSNELDWQAIGPYGGQVMDVAISPSDPNHLFAAVYGAGVYESTNGGKNWTAVNNGLTDLNVQQLLINNGAIYAATFDGGMFKSSDNGAHWFAINNGILSSTHLDFLVADTNILYTGGNVGILRSTDGGANWIQLPLPGPCNTLLIENKVMYADIPGGGLFKSGDDGQTWIQIGLYSIDSNIINALFYDNGVLYAAAQNNFGLADDSVYTSTDKGNTWTLASTGLGISNITSFAKKGNTIYAGANYNSIAGIQMSGGGVFETTDKGTTWTPTANPSYLSINKLIANNSTLYAATVGGLDESIDGGNNWTSINNGINGNSIISLLALSDAIYAGTTTAGIFKSTDNGNTWIPINNGPNLNTNLGIIGITSDNNKNIYVNYLISADYSLTGLNKSSDGGQHWVLLTPPNNYGPSQPSAMLTHGSTLYIGTIYGNVYKSLDGGISWQQFATKFFSPISGLFILNNSFYAINGAVYQTSLSGTPQWKSVSGHLFAATNTLITVNNGSQPKSLLALTSDGIYQNEDTQDWIPLNNGLPSATNVTSLLQLNNSTFIAGTSNGIYSSSNGDDYWETAGLNQDIINSVAGNNNYIFAGTPLGLYRENVQSFIKKNHVQ